MFDIPTKIEEKQNGIYTTKRMGDIYVSSIEWGYGCFIHRETLAFRPINEWTVTFYDSANNCKKETFRNAKNAILAAREFCIKGAVNLKFSHIPLF